ncbi:MAG: Gfo/Idh/MocA family oxidoreductase [Clostridia bacterium]|nr:Gfo/Idh/MocA family oxidoreductase [Clostridia bacterium]
MNFTMGILGFGGIAKFHYKVLAEKIPQITIKGAYDINAEKNESILEHGLLVYPDADSLLSDADIDLVLISTPNNFHKDYAIRAMRAGKHVLCEKPCMLSSEDLEEVLAVAKETGKIFTVHQNRRWDRDYLLIKQVLQEGTIGKPFFIESRVNGARGVPGDWRCVKEAGGGMMYDWGVHLIDQILQLFDCPITELYCQMFNLKYPEVDDNFKLSMKFENGTCVMIEVGTFHFIKAPRWLVHCDGGAMKIEDWGSGVDVVKELDTTMDWQESVVYTAAGPTRTMAARPDGTTEDFHIDIAEEKTNYKLYEMLIEGMETGDYSKVAVQPDEVRRSTRVMEAAFRSAREGILIKENI